MQTNSQILELAEQVNAYLCYPSMRVIRNGKAVEFRSMTGEVKVMTVAQMENYLG